ncbi:fatty acyl-AMP ligase [Oscillatoriales cyanobacterium LEGE 11467]|uniref:Fatty acyl-AMP ligase n=1 Tax=Zarconia navalis LEGE 11467 TaxID=1828826 RepID=A0A928VSW1_9CYAN|nr:fatty acyl-AMP ligase [Zarconia navalis]MBE9039769.1 fatty acyl-AMP ligase [Zarconia navalis LEGE 11467]
MTEYSTLVELLRHRAQHQPHQLAYTFLADGETESGQLTYGELDRQARAICAGLQSLGATDSRVLVVYPYTAGLEFVAAFFGCLYARAIAVTDNPPRHDRSLSKLQARAISSGATVVLTTQTLQDNIQKQLNENPELAPQLQNLPWLASDTISLDRAAHWQELDLAPDTLAFLQYTSGSTGTPKGVMVTHGNAIHNSTVIGRCFEHTPDSRGLVWLPLYHDMGLIGGVMQPLYAGFPIALMSPVALIQKPFCWLEGISHYRATTSGGPNFAYDLLCRQATPERIARLDLSCWEVAFSGAEPVRKETLDRFAETFAPCGFRREAFYPCYGMAETTLFITGATKADPPEVQYVDGSALEKNQVVPAAPDGDGVRAVVSCGRSWLGDRIEIVDPDSLKRCDGDRVGEIWISGSGVGVGYWKQPEETARTFQAHLADTGEGPFLRTGDLGFLRDGELYITGRIKDLMILWGRNHYPQHLELTVERSHPALRANAGAAFSIEVEGEEKLVIVYEVDRHFLRKLDAEEVFEAIRSGIAKHHLAEVYAIVLLKTGSIPKTTSGKIQRRGCRAQFLEGTLSEIARWHHPAESSDVVAMLDRTQV